LSPTTAKTTNHKIPPGSTLEKMAELEKIKIDAPSILSCRLPEASSKNDALDKDPIII